MTQMVWTHSGENECDASHREVLAEVDAQGNAIVALVLEPDTIDDRLDSLILVDPLAVLWVLGNQVSVVDLASMTSMKDSP